MIKCVVWDLDGTLLEGTYLESDQPPPANAELVGLLAELAGRGILHAIASKNPSEAAQHAGRVTGHAFAATACGWWAKSEAITTIMTDLGLVPQEVAFVENEALERAEVSFSLPDVLVLAPDEVAAAADWPQFSPPVVTDEARRRGELYAQRQARQAEATAFGGSRDEFLRYCQTRLTIAPADRGDLPRLHELSVRTHQFSSAGQAVSEAEFGDLLESAEHRVITARLSDKFGDDGLVGCCVIDTALRGVPGGRPPGLAQSAWQAWPLMMSCRAMGRGVMEALLAWICRAARDAGAGQVRLPCVVNPRNVPLRIALVASGFRVDQAQAGTADRPALYVKGLDQVPELPDWVQSASQDVTSQVLQILVELTGDSRPLRASLDTPLLRDGVGLDSLRGALLLTRLHRQFGVDVAGEDLNLDAMATIGTLAAFISRRVALRTGRNPVVGP